MESVKINNNIDFDRTILLCVFWVVRKTKTVEGCAPLFLCKIITGSKTYLPLDKRLKFTLSIISDIQEDSNHYKQSEIEILIGNELVDMFFNKERLYINLVNHKELENEIKGKLKYEFNKKHPRLCKNFIPKILA